MTAREVLDGIKKRGHSAGCAAHDDCLRANTARLTAALEAVLSECDATDTETDEALQADLADRIRAAIEGALKEGQ